MQPVSTGLVTFQYTTLRSLGGGSRSAAATDTTPSLLQLSPARISEGNDVAETDMLGAGQAVQDLGGPEAPGAPSAEDAAEDLEFLAFDDDSPAKAGDSPAPADSQPPGLLPEVATVAAAASPAAREVPWARASRRIRSPLLRLHNEVVGFCRFLAPSAEEEAGRREGMQRVADVVKAIWPSAEVQVFGSFSTGLYLPTSDMDLVVTGSGCTDVRAGLKAVANSLVRQGMAKNVQVISKAKVPIVKFEEVPSGLSFDVSFDVANGPEAAQQIKELMARLPPMRPLVLVLKIFLQQRELNEVYSGGIGSYALLVMVATFLLTHPSRHPVSTHSKMAGELEGSLGVLLVDFFRLYGRALNMNAVGISCRKGGSFFSKWSRGFQQEGRMYMLAVEDPNDPDNDIAKGSYNILKVRQAFDFAYSQLTGAVDPGESLLQRIIRLDDVLVNRPVKDDDDDEEDEQPAPSGRLDSAERNGHTGRKEHSKVNSSSRKKKRGRVRERSADIEPQPDESSEEEQQHRHKHKRSKQKHKDRRHSNHSSHRQRPRK